jgi:ABC-type glycerol-3-phosphate transport system permease component
MTTKARNMLFQTINYLILTLFMFICVYPFYRMLLYTISDPTLAASRGVYFVPVGLTFSNYAKITKLENISSAAVTSTLRTLFGTITTVLCSALFGYLLTNERLRFRKAIYRYTVVTMYFNAGLIPWYLTMVFLGLRNNFLLYILPHAVTPFYVVLTKTYMEQIPTSMEESAKIDGAGTFAIFFKIIAPISLPIIATIAVFSAVSQWNTWMDNLLLVNKKGLQTLQLVLLRYLREADALARAIERGATTMDLAESQAYRLTPTSVRMTITMVVTIPIVLVYPFMQRFFVKGIMLGAIKA